MVLYVLSMVEHDITNVTGNGEAADHDGMGMDDCIYRDDGMGMDDSIDRDDGMERDGVKRDDDSVSGVGCCGGVLQDCGKGMYV